MSSTAVGFFFSMLTALLVIAGDTVIKIAADQGKSLVSWPMILGYGFYMVSAVAWYGAMRHVELGQGGVAYAMFSLLALCLIGVVVFGEHIGLREYAGIACALASMVLLSKVA